MAKLDCRELAMPFKDVVPPLSTLQRESLEERCLADGIQDTIKVTVDDEILDGHHRYEISQKHGIGFRVQCIRASKDWDEDRKRFEVEQYALSRRQLSPDQQRDLIQQRNARILKCLEQGMSQVAVARRYGISQSRVSRLAATLAGEQLSVVHTAQRGEVRLSGEERLEVRDRLSSGESQSQVAADFGVTQQAVSRIANSQPHVSNNSQENNEWYTPPPIIEAAREVMGGIDVDPCSSLVAQHTVQANAFYTADDDGLNQEWIGRVWMNPPYGTALISRFCAKLLLEIEERRTSQACVLVNNATETEWFQLLASSASRMCLLRGRVKFLDSSGNAAKSPLQGQCVLYFGGRRKRFGATFASLGVCAEFINE